MKYYSAHDVAGLIGVSQKTAYKRIQNIHKLLQEKSGSEIILVEKGKIPVDTFHEYYPYIPRLQKGVENNNENTTT